MSEEITESAKAVQEIAKTTGQAIGVVDKVGSFFARIMKEPIDSTCGMLADTLRFKRWQRQLSLIEKAERIIGEKHLDTRFRPVSPKLALPIFHNASMEDEESLHDLWAKLLVASLDPAVKTPRRAFVEIITQLEPLDVRIMKELFDLYSSERKEQGRWSGQGHEPSNIRLNSYRFRKNLGVDNQSYWAAIDNLQRLGLCQSYIDQDSLDTRDHKGEEVHAEFVSYHGGYDILSITALGLEFVRICTYDEFAEPAVAPDSR